MSETADSVQDAEARGEIIYRAGVPSSTTTAWQIARRETEDWVIFNVYGPPTAYANFRADARRGDTQAIGAAFNQCVQYVATRLSRT